MSNIDPTSLRKGQTITIQLDRHDEPRRVRVVRVPPFTERMMNEEREHTDAVDIMYPGTSLDGGNFFGNITEIVPADAIVDD